MSKPRRLHGPRALGELMGATLGTAKIARGVGRARAILAWPQAVGPEISRLTRPRSQQGGTLYVEVRDSAHAHHLTMQRHHFLKALNALLPDAPLTEIRFSVGSVREATPAAPVRPLPAPDRAKARRLVRDVPEGLQSSALRAAEAITRARKWREEQGYRPCPVCGEPSAEQPCRACALTLADPNVGRAARRLLREPEALAELPAVFGNSGTDAARYLALNMLGGQLALLALECVCGGPGEADRGEAQAGEADPGEVQGGYRAFLAQQAEVYLSLALRKPRAAVVRADRAHLPEQARQVLSAGR